jgi:LacI family transcriptional regulator
MKDIAAELGVSVITVSKVLRNQGRISTKTRERVLRRAKELNYRPDLMARSLATGRSCMVGMVVPDLTHPFFAAIAKVLARNLSEKGYSLVISSSDEDPGLELHEVESLLARRIDALVLSSSEGAKTSSLYRCLERSGVPYLLLDRPVRGLNAHFVGSNDKAIGEMATQHLIDRGYRRIAHIGLSGLSTGTRRLEGYKHALKLHKIAAPANRVVLVGSGDAQGEESGQSAMQSLLSLKSRPDAVFCYNDIIASGAQKAVLEAGLSIPQDIALIGVSNLAGFSFYSPQVPLSTVDQDVPGLATEAMLLIMEMQRNPRPSTPRKIYVPTRLVIRAST